LNNVILVDESDVEVGIMEKMQAHQEGVLHRAFSIFILNSRGDMLLQQRSDEKYHSGGLWTNACCSHPSPGEENIDAAHRRLAEELGFDTHLNKIFSFTYRAEFGNGLVENEFDHVFLGFYDGPVFFNPLEVKSVAYYGIDQVRKELEENPGKYTEWFRIAFPKVETYIASSI
jgi:isopentenyl-diphosphate Delta-isomerase